MSDSLAFVDAMGQAEMIRRGDARPEELVEAAIGRIEQLNPRLNAVIHRLFEKARAQVGNGGLREGPLRGVPFLLKDIFGYTAGDPYHMSVRPLRDVGFVAPHDTYLAAKLRAAGLVFLGRTNCSELGTLPTVEAEAYGPARNPWDESRSTGGSSGGSAAAVASGMVPAAHANDGGGSIRIPASCCGLVGLKPSRGRISLGPDLAEAVGGLAVEGSVSRTVRDTAALLDVMEGEMPGDPYTAPPPSRPFLREVGADPGRLRIGLLTAMPGGLGATHPDAVSAAEDAGRLLESLGHDVEPSHPAALDDLEVGQHFAVMFASYTARLFEVLGMLTGRELGPEDVEPINWMLASTGRACSATQFLASADWLNGYRRAIASWWAGGFDLLCTPTLPEPPPLLGSFAAAPDDMSAGGMRATQYTAFVAPFNMTGQPAVSLPLHWNAQGLPIGVQLVAAYGREDLLLRVASQLEQARPWADRRPPVRA